jgi:two-component system, OmpR family, alkaline phosphatase synthesis response regulator PhoP
MHVLLVEDDQLTANMVQVNLEHEGFTVTVCRDGGAGHDAMESGTYDLFIFDLMLPIHNGADLVRRARHLGLGTPIMMLTARSEMHVKVEALELGADDYLTKPFYVPELIARSRALIRRSQAMLEAPADRCFHFGEVLVDLDRQAITQPDGSLETVGEREMAMIALFAREPRRVLSRADILEEVWGMEKFPSERTVDNYVVRLRRLIERVPDEPRVLVSVRGRGYRYDPHEGSL